MFFYLPWSLSYSKLLFCGVDWCCNWYDIGGVVVFVNGSGEWLAYVGVIWCCNEDDADDAVLWRTFNFLYFDEPDISKFDPWLHEVFFLSCLVEFSIL